MNKLWESVRFFLGAHKAASIAVASVVGVSAVGAGGYGIYNALSTDADEVIEEVEVSEEAAAEDVYLPEFKNIVLTSESLEKDLTIYISDENDNALTGVAFEVKILTPETAEQLQTYIDAINDLDAQISEMLISYGIDEAALPVDGEDASDAEDESDEAVAEEGTESEDEAEDTQEADTAETVSDKILEVLRERNVPITVTDEDGNVVETQKSSIKDDPLYLLYIDKETAVQAFAMALKEAEGQVYVDEDEDGVIAQTDMEPGDYVACLLNDFDNEEIYEPTSYATDVNVKDKVEYKVQKEITKQIKKDVASEDGQKTEATPVEATLTDTVEYVASSKVENGSSSVKSTTSAVAPTSTASSSKATVKSGGKTSTTHDVTVSVTTYTITLKYVDSDGKEIATAETQTVNKDAAYSFSPKTIDGYTATSTAAVTGTATKDDTITFKYTKNAAKTYTITTTYVDESGNKLADSTTQTIEENKSYTCTAKEISGYTLEGDSTKSGTATADATVTFTYKKNVEENDSTEGDGTSDDSTTDTTEDVAFRSHRAIAGNKVAAQFTVLRAGILGAKVTKTATNTTTEKATLDMSYSAGTFTISATTNVGSVTVNGTAVTMKDGKGTFTATGNGDYVLKGVATFSDKYQDSSLTVTYTVSGYGSASTDTLKDTSGNELYLDEACTKKATAADYVKGKTYYYKVAGYTYYGWQTIDGNTYYFNKNGDKVTGTQIIQGVQYDFGTDGVLVVKGTGIDVSKYQGNIDWASAKSAINFAIVRCGYRGMYDGQLHEDPYFYKNMSGAKAAGVNVGVYIYSTALNEAEAVQEASMAVAMAQKAGGCSYPIYLDMEDTTRGQSRLSTAERMAIVNAFCSTVQSSGYKAGLYCSKNWMTARMDAGSVPSSCSIWIAQYNTSCTYSGRKNMWQYSSKGSVPGIKGYVDMNKSF